MASLVSFRLSICQGLLISCFIIAPGFAVVNKCPPAEDIIPCRCYNDTINEIVHCVSNGADDFPFAKIFGAFEQVDNVDHEWNTFLFGQTGITEIPDDAFGSLTFLNVELSYHRNLTRINPKAFSKLANTLQHLSFTNTPLSNSEEVFQLFDSLPNLYNVYIDNTNLTRVPDFALGFHPNIRNFIVKGSELDYIGMHAVYGCSRADVVEFTRTGTQNLTIHPQAFEFGDFWNGTLELWLENLSLTPEILKPVNLAGFNGRQVTIHISHNPDLAYLPEEAFEPFLNNPGNRVYFAERTGPHFKDCSDCRNAWIVKKGFVDNQVFHFNPGSPYRNIECRKNGIARNLAAQDFSHCEEA